MIVYDVQDLVKIYPGQTQPANAGISLQVYSGEIFGLLGDNGAGKTTLVRQMLNLTPSTSGQILFMGQAVQTDPLRVASCVGYMPQDVLAINNLTVGEALYFTAHLRGLTRPAARQERERLIEQLGIGELRGKIGPRLSGGQRRLVQLAVALAAAPPVLILDEPSNNLDPQRRAQVWELLRARNQQGATIILITHDAIEAEKVIERVGILRAGKLAALGRPSELKAQLDRQLRLELRFAPESPPRLPPGLAIHSVQPGRWVAYLDRSQAAAVLQALELERLDDFQLGSATLEDLYLYYYADGAQTPTLP